MTERVEAIRRRVDGLPAGPWESPLRDLGQVPSFAAVDFYFDQSYEAYPPLGESGPVFVAPTKEIADFLAHAREDVPYLLAALTEAQAEVGRLTAELDKALPVLCDTCHQRMAIRCRHCLSVRAEEAVEADLARVRAALETTYLYAPEPYRSQARAALEGR